MQTTDKTDSITVPGKSRFPGALWRACARSFQGVLVIQRGDVITGLRLLRAGLYEFDEARVSAAFLFWSAVQNSL